MPSVSATGVSTSRMLAPGAIAWAYWTSRLVSAAQLDRTGSGVVCGFQAGTLPAGWMIVKLGGSARPNVLSNVLRSASAVGLPKASTIAIVVPAPVVPLEYSGSRL